MSHRHQQHTERKSASCNHRHKIIIRINITNTMIYFWPLAPWVMEMLKVSWRFPHEGLTLTRTLRRLWILFSIIVIVSLLVWMVIIRMAVMMMKSLTWHKSWPVEEALLWTEAKAAEPVDGARAGLRVWKILPLCLIFSMIVVILVVFEKMATKPLEWGDHVVAIFYDDGDDGWLTSAVNSKSLSTNICGSLFTHWKANITGFLVIGMLQGGYWLSCD